MNKNSIVQFVGFVTDLEPDAFITIWQPYAKQLVNIHDNVILQEAIGARSVSKFKYVSQHECNANDFRFAFMKERSRTDFPEHKARVVQTGGYTPVQIQCQSSEIKDDVKVIAFVGHGENDLNFYHRQTYRHLNIYEAYFENCSHSYVMEFFIQEQEAPALVKLLKTRTGIEAGFYKECPVFQSL